MPGFRTRETIDIFNVDDLIDEVDVLSMDDLDKRVEGMKVAEEIGLTTCVKEAKPIDVLALNPVDLSHLGDVIMFDI
jgi:hypothetical protein